MFRKLQGSKALKRFARARDGVAAVQFAMVAMPFFWLTFGLLEVTMIGFAQTSLDFATAESSREIRTGQAQLGGVTHGEIKAEMCAQMRRLIVLDCANVDLDVRSYASFLEADAAVVNPVQNGQFQTGQMGYSPGQPSNVVVVRAYYRWDIVTPMFEPLLANLGASQRILVSTMMFRSEPYQ